MILSNYQRKGFAFGVAFENDAPELKPIKDKKVENIFFCSFVFGQPNMQPIVVQEMRI